MRQQKDQTPLYREKKDNKKTERISWLLVLFLVAFITSCITGYILGRNAGTAPTGQIMDTILLSPEKEPEKQPKTILHLSGQTLYTDGTPAAGRTMELHSTPIRTVTDENGFFLFPNVEEGEHFVSVLNEDGTVAAQRAVFLSREDSIAGADVVLQDSGSYVIQLSVDVRLLEITVELDGGNLYINPDMLTWASSDSRVTTPAGTVSAAVNPVVTPCGNVCLSDGTIVFPGGKEVPTAIILPDDTVIFPEKLTTLGEGLKVQPDGVVIFPDGTQIYPGGVVATPDGKRMQSGSSGLVIEEGTAVPIGGENSDIPPGERTDAPDVDQEIQKEEYPALSAQPIPTPEGEKAPTLKVSEENPPLPEKNGGTNVDNGNGGGAQSGEETEESTEEEPKTGESTEEEPEPPEDTGKLTVSGQKENNDDLVDWTQSSTLDLFFDRTSGRPYEKIAPGSKGYYLFQLQNTRQKELQITLTLTEASELHLPLNFTLTPVDESGRMTDEKAVSGSLASGKRDMGLDTVIKGNGQQSYRLDWQWPLNGNDREDTAAGSTGGTYMLSLTIHAEEEK